jgi:hypothetical protein
LLALIAGFVLALSPPRPAVPQPAVNAMSGAVVGAGTTPSTSAVPMAQVATTAAPPVVPDLPAQQQGGDQNSAKTKIKNKGHGH